jgi:hypothetical protein
LGSPKLAEAGALGIQSIKARAAADFALYIVACIAVIVMVLTWK